MPRLRRPKESNTFGARTTVHLVMVRPKVPGPISPVAQHTIQIRLPSRLSAHPSGPDGSILTYHHPSPRRSMTFNGVILGIAAILSPDAKLGLVLKAKNASGGLVFAT
jgi:hypothetical protein